MKYKFEIVIQLDQAGLFDLALDRSSLLKWKSGFSDVELVSGIPAEPGVKYNLTVTKKNKPLIIPETITVINRPFEYHSEYLFDGVLSHGKNQFLKIDNNSTKYVAEFDLKFPVAFINFFLWLIGPIARLQAKKVLKRFKEFAENRYQNEV